jgi:hypothetical protein
MTTSTTEKSFLASMLCLSLCMKSSGERVRRLRRALQSLDPSQAEAPPRFCRDGGPFARKPYAFLRITNENGF